MASKGAFIGRANKKRQTYYFLTTILLLTFDKPNLFDGVKDSKELTVVRDEGDAELGLVGGIFTGHKRIIGVGVDLRQQLINNNRDLSKLASADLSLHGGPKCRYNLH